MSWIGNLDATGATRVNIVTGGGLPLDAARESKQLPDNHQVTVSNLPATQPVSAVALPLPTGAATAALQLPDNHQVAVSNFPATQSVSAVSLPLPTGAATAANQLPNNHQVTVSNFPASQIATIGGVNLDAFSRLRTSEPVQLFQSNVNYDLDPIDMESGATGTGIIPTRDAAVRIADLTVAAGTGTSFMQSFTHVPYQPGRSHLIFLTFVLGAGVANVTKDVGYFGNSNGIFLRQNGTSGLQIGIRTATSGVVVDSFVNQAAWNVDKFDGTGSSGLTFDASKSQILVIDLQFLGHGRVRVGFDINGEIMIAHQYQHANNLAIPYMQTASLPIQALVTATASLASATLRYKCSSVISEGGVSAIPTIVVSTPEATVTAASGARTHILSIRPKLTFNGATNRSNAQLHKLAIIVTGTTPIRYELVHGVTFSVAPTWADINTTYSAFEYGTGGTFSSVASGLIIDAGYLTATNQAKESNEFGFQHYLPLTLDRAGAQRAMGTISILVTGLGGTSDVRCSVHLDEYR